MLLLLLMLMLMLLLLLLLLMLLLLLLPLLQLQLIRQAVASNACQLNLNQRINFTRIYGTNRCCGSGFALLLDGWVRIGILIRIQEGQNNPQKRRKFKI
jgi:hypothetical protein